MAFSEKIKLLFDVDTVSASKNIKGLRSDVAAADGAFGKAKAGAGGLATMVKENMGAAAIAAGTAIVAFGIKAVGAFTDTATAARELGDAVGLSTEDASRWIAVADDMEVGADELVSGLGKIAKTLDDSKWKDYGIATRDAGGNARDTNDILLDSFDMLGKITNETQRAKVGNELFGKGYANLAPLIGKSRTEYEGMLAAVEGGQVVTDKEAEKAEKMRLAQDAMADAMQEVTLATGEFVAELAPLIEFLAKTILVVTRTQDAVEDFALRVVGLDGPVAGLGQGFGTAEQKAKDLSNAMDNTTGPMASVRGYLEQLKDKARDAAKETHGLAQTADELKAALKKADDALQEMKGHIDDRQAWRNMKESIEEMRVAIAGGEASMNDMADASDEAALAMADVIEQAENIPAEVKTRLYQELDAGNLNEVERMLERWQQGYRIPLYPKVITSSGGPNPGAVIPIVGAFDSGGKVPGPIGQEQLAIVHSGETILPTHKGDVSMPGAVGPATVNNYFDMTGAVVASQADFERMVTTALNRVERRGGRTGRS